MANVRVHSQRVRTFVAVDGPAEAEAPDRAAQTWALLSTLSVGLGLAALATGVTLLLLPNGAEVQAAPSASGARMLFEQRFKLGRVVVCR